eukprot:1701636-Pleurochrysis_carterae.AAC.1
MAHPIMARLLLLLGVSEAAAAMEGAARVTGNRPTGTMTAVNAYGATLPGRPASRAARASTLRVPFSPQCAELDKDDLPTGELDQLSKDLYDEITSREVRLGRIDDWRRKDVANAYEMQELVILAGLERCRNADQVTDEHGASITRLRSGGAKYGCVQDTLYPICKRCVNAWRVIALSSVGV